MDVTLEIIKGSRKTRWIRLKSPESFVGRRDDCDVRIPSARVSRRHCRLSFYDDLLHVEDLQSANGTFVNGQPVSQPVVVQPGDMLEVGPVEFRINYPLSASARAKLNGDDAPLVLEEDVSLHSQPVAEELEPVLLEEGDSSVVELEPVLLEEGEAPQDNQVAEVEPVLLEEDDGALEPVLLEEGNESYNGSTEQLPSVEPVDDEEEILPTFDEEGPWNLPDEGDLRDILSKLEE